MRRWDVWADWHSRSEWSASSLLSAHRLLQATVASKGNTNINIIGEAVLTELLEEGIRNPGYGIYLGLVEIPTGRLTGHRRIE